MVNLTNAVTARSRQVNQAVLFGGRCCLESVCVGYSVLVRSTLLANPRPGGVVLALSWRCPGVVLVSFWRCPGVVLTIVLALSWRCPGVVLTSPFVVLALSWCRSGVVLALSWRLSWRCPGVVLTIVLALSWHCPGIALRCPGVVLTSPFVVLALSWCRPGVVLALSWHTIQVLLQPAVQGTPEHRAICVANDFDICVFLTQSA